MKKSILILAMLALVGCSNTATTLSFPAMPVEFSDCKIVRMYNAEGENITMARCPNSTTAVKTGGKNPKTVIVVDGTTYEATK